MEQVGTGSVGVTEVLGEHVSNPPNAASAGWTFHVSTEEGRIETWVVPALQNRVKGQFEQWVRGQAQRLIAMTATTDPDEADKQRSRMTADFVAGKYNWEEEDSAPDAGDLIRAAVQSLDGARHLLWLLMRQITSQKDVTPKRVKQLFSAAPQDCLLAFRWALGNSPAPVTGQGSASNGKPVTQSPPS